LLKKINIKSAPKGASFALCISGASRTSPPTALIYSYDLACAFADHKKSVNRKNAPRFRVIFAPAKIELGEAQEVLEKRRTDGAIKRHGFCFFL
jgi:hypothetical protein